MKPRYLQDRLGKVYGRSNNRRYRFWIDVAVGTAESATIRRTVLEWKQQQLPPPTAANRRLNLNLDDTSDDGDRTNGDEGGQFTLQASSHAVGKSELLSELFGGEGKEVSFRSEQFNLILCSFPVARMKCALMDMCVPQV